MPGARFVARPQAVAERFDDVIGRDADVGRPLLQHLHNGLQHPCQRTERSVLSLVEAPQPVEVPEKLVSPVDEMHDHPALLPVGEFLPGTG
jgi:hypothetical protein